MTEQGYDIHQGSPVKAIPVGNRTAAETQADWTLRSALLYARRGIHRSFFYQLYDLNVESATKYASMGFVDKLTITRKPAADFLFQTIKLFGEYRFQETRNTDPFVDRYECKGQPMYVLAVPDEVGRTVNYTLSLPGIDSVSLYTPLIGSDEMSKQRLAVTDGQLPLIVTETPMFIVPDTSSQLNTLFRTDFSVKERDAQELGKVAASAKEKIVVYPNPTNGQLQILNKAGGQWKFALLDLRGNKLYEANASGYSKQIGLQQLPAGIYPLYVMHEDRTVISSQFVIKQ